MEKERGSIIWDGGAWEESEKAEDTESSDSGCFILSEEVVFLL